MGNEIRVRFRDPACRCSFRAQDRGRDVRVAAGPLVLDAHVGRLASFWASSGGTRGATPMRAVTVTRAPEHRWPGDCATRLCCGRAAQRTIDLELCAVAGLDVPSSRQNPLQTAAGKTAIFPTDLRLSPTRVGRAGDATARTARSENTRRKGTPATWRGRRGGLGFAAFRDKAPEPPTSGRHRSSRPRRTSYGAGSSDRDRPASNHPPGPARPS